MVAVDLHDVGRVAKDSLPVFCIGDAQLIENPGGVIVVALLDTR